MFIYVLKESGYMAKTKVIWHGIVDITNGIALNGLLVIVVPII